MIPKEEIVNLDDLIKLLQTITEDRIQVDLRDDGGTDFYEMELNSEKLCKLTNSLMKDDYFRGPTPDKNPNRKHFVWEFKKKYLEKVIYLKFKVINKNKILVYFSIHLDRQGK